MHQKPTAPLKRKVSHRVGAATFRLLYPLDIPVAIFQLTPGDMAALSKVLFRSSAYRTNIEFATRTAAMVASLHPRLKAPAPVPFHIPQASLVAAFQKLGASDYSLPPASRLCSSVHGQLNAQVVASIRNTLETLAEEFLPTLVRSAGGVEELSVETLTLVAAAENVMAFALSASEFRKTYKRAVPSQFVQIDGPCDACFLTRVGSDPTSLVALRGIAIASRVAGLTDGLGNQRSKSAVDFLNNWMAHHWDAPVAALMQASGDMADELTRLGSSESCPITLGRELRTRKVAHGFVKTSTKQSPRHDQRLLETESPPQVPRRSSQRLICPTRAETTRLTGSQPTSAQSQGKSVMTPKSAPKHAHVRPRGPSLADLRKQLPRNQKHIITASITQSNYAGSNGSATSTEHAFATSQELRCDIFPPEARRTLLAQAGVQPATSVTTTSQQSSQYSPSVCSTMASSTVTTLSPSVYTRAAQPCRTTKESSPCTTRDPTLGPWQQLYAAGLLPYDHSHDSLACSSPRYSSHSDRSIVYQPANDAPRAGGRQYADALSACFYEDACVSPSLSEQARDSSSRARRAVFTDVRTGRSGFGEVMR